MNFEAVKEQLECLLSIADTLRKDLDVSYMDAVIETLDNLVSGEVHVEGNLPHKEIRKELVKKYADINLDILNNSEKRKLVQYLILQTYRKEEVQANHQMTPDIVGLFVYDILRMVLLEKKERTLLDITVGTGNLLSSVLYELQRDKFKIQAFGIENDETLITLASINVELENLPVELFHQDALDGLVVPQVDAVIGDLPVGYYPLDDKVKNFKTRAVKGHSYVHHLLIEQSINQLKDGGIAVLIVPVDLFRTEESKTLLEYIQSNAYLQGMIALSSNMFRDRSNEKAFLILQKKGGNAKQVDKILLGSFPNWVNEEEDAKRFHDELIIWGNRNFKDRK